jgi:hypothetical protein
MKMNEWRSPSYLNELLTNHLARYIDSNKKLIDENYDSEMASYVRSSKIIFETQLEIKRNAEEYYSGRIGKMPIYDLASFLVMASSMFVPAHLRDKDASKNADTVGAGDQVPNAHLAARLSMATGLSFPCLLAVTQFDHDGCMSAAHELVSDDGKGNPQLTMFGLGVVMSLNSEGVDLEEEILALLEVPEGME